MEKQQNKISAQSGIVKRYDEFCKRSNEFRINGFSKEFLEREGEGRNIETIKRDYINTRRYVLMALSEYLKQNSHEDKVKQNFSDDDKKELESWFMVLSDYLKQNGYEQEVKYNFSDEDKKELESWFGEICKKDNKVKRNFEESIEANQKTLEELNFSLENLEKDVRFTKLMFILQSGVSCGKYKFVDGFIFFYKAGIFELIPEIHLAYLGEDYVKSFIEKANAVDKKFETFIPKRKESKFAKCFEDLRKRSNELKTSGFFNQFTTNYKEPKHLSWATIGSSRTGQINTIESPETKHFLNIRRYFEVCVIEYVQKAELEGKIKISEEYKKDYSLEKNEKEALESWMKKNLDQETFDLIEKSAQLIVEKLKKAKFGDPIKGINSLLDEIKSRDLTEYDNLFKNLEESLYKKLTGDGLADIYKAGCLDYLPPDFQKHLSDNVIKEFFKKAYKINVRYEEFKLDQLLKSKSQSKQKSISEGMTDILSLLNTKNLNANILATTAEEILKIDPTANEKLPLGLGLDLKRVKENKIFCRDWEKYSVEGGYQRFELGFGEFLKNESMPWLYCDANIEQFCNDLLNTKEITKPFSKLEEYMKAFIDMKITLVDSVSNDGFYKFLEEDRFFLKFEKFVLRKLIDKFEYFAIVPGLNLDDFIQYASTELEYIFDTKKENLSKEEENSKLFLDIFQGKVYSGKHLNAIMFIDSKKNYQNILEEDGDYFGFKRYYYYISNKYDKKGGLKSEKLSSPYIKLSIDSIIVNDYHDLARIAMGYELKRYLYANMELCSGGASQIDIVDIINMLFLKVPSRVFINWLHKFDEKSLNDLIKTIVYRRVRYAYGVVIGTLSSLTSKTIEDLSKKAEPELKELLKELIERVERAATKEDDKKLMASSKFDYSAMILALEIVSEEKQNGDTKKETLHRMANDVPVADLYNLDNSLFNRFVAVVLREGITYNLFDKEKYFDFIKKLDADRLRTYKDWLDLNKDKNKSINVYKTALELIECKDESTLKEKTSKLEPDMINELLEFKLSVNIKDILLLTLILKENSRSNKETPNVTDRNHLEEVSSEGIVSFLNGALPLRTQIEFVNELRKRINNMKCPDKTSLFNKLTEVVIRKNIPCGVLGVENFERDVEILNTNVLELYKQYLKSGRVDKVISDILTNALEIIECKDDNQLKDKVSKLKPDMVKKISNIGLSESKKEIFVAASEIIDCKNDGDLNRVVNRVTGKLNDHVIKKILELGFSLGGDKRKILLGILELRDALKKQKDKIENSGNQNKETPKESCENNNGDSKLNGNEMGKNICQISKSDNNDIGNTSWTHKNSELGMLERFMGNIISGKFPKAVVNQVNRLANKYKDCFKILLDNYNIEQIESLSKHIGNNDENIKTALVERKKKLENSVKQNKEMPNGSCCNSNNNNKLNISETDKKVYQK